MGRKSKKVGGRKPPRPALGAPPTNADWDDSTAAFRKEAESAIRALSDGGGAAAAARLAERHPASPLAHHVLGHARASAALAGDAVPALRRAAELAPRCPGIAATLASALLYARRPGEALAECARALAVVDPTDPALHAAASRRGGLTAPSPQARVAAARERLLGVRADAEALEATGFRRGAAAAGDGADEDVLLLPPRHQAERGGRRRPARLSHGELRRPGGALRPNGQRAPAPQGSGVCQGHQGVGVLAVPCLRQCFLGRQLVLVTRRV